MSMRPTTAWAAFFILAAVSAPLDGQVQTPKPGGRQAPHRSSEIVSSTISGFNIVLVVGESQPSGSTSAQDLPAAAKKALNDMREFLPYKQYRVLDVQWTSCCAPQQHTAIRGRLQGVTGVPAQNGAINLLPRAYGFMIGASASQANLPIRFMLNLEESGTGSRQMDNARALERERQDLRAEIETLGLQIKNMQTRIEIGTEPGSLGSLRPMQDRHASLKRRLADLESETAHAGSPTSRSIIDSSFTMDAGETVVVGTSRLGGDKALIAIVTAVRKTPEKRE